MPRPYLETGNETKEINADLGCQERGMPRPYLETENFISLAWEGRHAVSLIPPFSHSRTSCRTVRRSSICGRGVTPSPKVSPRGQAVPL